LLSYLTNHYALLCPLTYLHLIYKQLLANTLRRRTHDGARSPFPSLAIMCKVKQYRFTCQHYLKVRWDKREEDSQQRKGSMLLRTIYLHQAVLRMQQVPARFMARVLAGKTRQSHCLPKWASREGVTWRRRGNKTGERA